MFLIYISVQQ